jgi:membrane protein
MNKKILYQLFKTSFKDWLADNSSIRAAALTFFIILPLPSILLIVVAFFGVFIGQTQATQNLIQQISVLAGPAVAGLFKELLGSSTSPFSSAWVAITTVAFSLGGAIGAFAVLRDTMDVIWEVKFKESKSFRQRFRQRIGPFIVVSVLGLIVIAWTGLATVVFSAIRYFSINGSMARVTITIAQILGSFALSTLLFALTYKLIPDTKVHWIDVALASILAGVAFTVTNYIIGTYIETFTVTTIIGAAGSLVIILLWIFIINQIMLFGAEVSKDYATTFSSEHTREHYSPTAEKIVKSLEKAGEAIEQATKENDTETQVEKAAKPESNKVAEKTEIKPPHKEENQAENVSQEEQAIEEEKAEAEEPKNTDEGSI